MLLLVFGDISMVTPTRGSPGHNSSSDSLKELYLAGVNRHLDASSSVDTSKQMWEGSIEKVFARVSVCDYAYQMAFLGK